MRTNARPRQDPRDAKRAAEITYGIVALDDEDYEDSDVIHDSFELSDVLGDPGLRHIDRYEN